MTSLPASARARCLDGVMCIVTAARPSGGVPETTIVGVGAMVGANNERHTLGVEAGERTVVVLFVLDREAQLQSAPSRTRLGAAR